MLTILLPARDTLWTKINNLLYAGQLVDMLFVSLSSSFFLFPSVTPSHATKTQGCKVPRRPRRNHSGDQFVG